jgi:hypothetical protein
MTVRQTGMVKFSDQSSSLLKHKQSELFERSLPGLAHATCLADSSAAPPASGHRAVHPGAKPHGETNTLTVFGNP